MTFLIRPGTPRYDEQLRARAFEAWRTYSAYRGALDHEADAAAELENLARFGLAEAA
jgi:hypothetical protein